jgi:hypothetical protein
MIIQMIPPPATIDPNVIRGFTYRSNDLENDNRKIPIMMGSTLAKRISHIVDLYSGVSSASRIPNKV